MVMKENGVIEILTVCGGFVHTMMEVLRAISDELLVFTAERDEYEKA